MELNLKGIGKKDMHALKNVPKERKKIIRDSSSSPIKTDYVANELAQTLHPSVQYVKVENIIEENANTKTFILAPDIDKGTKKLAYFKPGQYISVQISIERGVYRRPYTISSSPKKAFDNTYSITIKRRNKGIVSNYFLDFVKIGDKFSISAPVGEFTYEPLRDAKNIIALAGGSGITPFISMAEAVADGILDIKLTILYGIRTTEDILFQERFETITKNCNLVNIIYILSEETNEEYENGFISKELIDQYIEEETSFFVCGPLAMYDYVNELLENYNLPKKYIRHDVFFGKVEIQENKEFNLTILTKGKETTILCRSNETLLTAIEKNGIIAPSKCHVGECGFCRSRLRSGKVRVLGNSIRMADQTYNYIHPCASFPESDCVVELPN